MKARSKLYLTILVSLGILTLLGKELLIINPELFIITASIMVGSSMIKYESEAMTGELDQRAAKIANDYRNGQELKVDLKAKELIYKEKQSRLVAAHGYTEVITGGLINHGLETTKNELLTTKMGETVSKLKTTQIFIQGISKKVVVKQSMVLPTERRNFFMPTRKGLGASVCGYATYFEMYMDRERNLIERLEAERFPYKHLDLYRVLPFEIQEHIIHLLMDDEVDVESFFRQKKHIHTHFARYIHQAWICMIHLRHRMYNSTVNETRLVMEWIGIYPQPRMKMGHLTFEYIIEYVSVINRLDAEKRKDFLTIVKAKLNHVQICKDPILGCCSEIPNILLEDYGSSCQCQLEEGLREIYVNQIGSEDWEKTRYDYTRDRPKIFATIVLETIQQECPEAIPEKGAAILRNPLFKNVEKAFKVALKDACDSYELTWKFRDNLCNMESIPSKWRKKVIDDTLFLFNEKQTPVDYPEVLEADIHLESDEEPLEPEMEIYEQSKGELEELSDEEFKALFHFDEEEESVGEEKDKPEGEEGLEEEPEWEEEPEEKPVKASDKAPGKKVGK
jgi:hypothetical protein